MWVPEKLVVGVEAGGGMTEWGGGGERKRVGVVE